MDVPWLRPRPYVSLRGMLAPPVPVVPGQQGAPVPQLACDACGSSAIPRETTLAGTRDAPIILTLCTDWRACLSAQRAAARTG